MILQDMAQVFIGILPNREMNEKGMYVYNLFNLKSYEDNKESYEIVKTDKDLSHKLTKKGDLIFRLVYPNKVIYIDEQLEGFLVPSQWCVIRPDKEIINSNFLKWYLENDSGKEEILTNVTGSTVQKISIESLKNIQIPVIDLQKQKYIEDLINLWEREKKILIEIMENKDILYKNVIEEVIKKEEKI